MFMYVYYLLYVSHMFSHNGYGPGTDGGPAAPWALGLGPGPISIMAQRIYIKGSQ